jgi:hypothetical protein
MYQLTIARRGQGSAAMPDPHHVTLSDNPVQSAVAARPYNTSPASRGAPGRRDQGAQHSSCRCELDDAVARRASAQDTVMSIDL